MKAEEVKQIKDDNELMTTLQKLCESEDDDNVLVELGKDEEFFNRVIKIKKKEQEKERQEQEEQEES